MSKKTQKKKLTQDLKEKIRIDFVQGIDEENGQRKSFTLDELIKKSGINNSKITQNIQNNIKLLAYKNTDISTISDNDIIKCINHNNMCIPQLIKMIHLDPQKPENHNIYISNLKNG